MWIFVHYLISFKNIFTHSWYVHFFSKRYDLKILRSKNKEIWFFKKKNWVYWQHQLIVYELILDLFEWAWFWNMHKIILCWLANLYTFLIHIFHYFLFSLQRVLKIICWSLCFAIKWVSWESFIAKWSQLIGHINIVINVSGIKDSISVFVQSQI